jgi:hypothetical protein
MKAKGFIPKVKQLEQLKIELDENDEREIKVNSKKKIDNRAPMKLGFTNDSDDENDPKQEGFRKMPMMFVNKNAGAGKYKKPNSPQKPDPNSIAGMFANAKNI